jgi:hypothetical protein
MLIQRPASSVIHKEPTSIRVILNNYRPVDVFQDFDANEDELKSREAPIDVRPSVARLLKQHARKAIKFTSCDNLIDKLAATLNDRFIPANDDPLPDEKARVAKLTATIASNVHSHSTATRTCEVENAGSTCPSLKSITSGKNPSISSKDSLPIPRIG